jgi:hypothetical protein
MKGKLTQRAQRTPRSRTKRWILAFEDMHLLELAHNGILEHRQVHIHVLREKAMAHLIHVIQAVIPDGFDTAAGRSHHLEPSRRVPRFLTHHFTFLAGTTKIRGSVAFAHPLQASNFCWRSLTLRMAAAPGPSPVLR